MSTATPKTTARHKWIAGYAHWGQADIYYLCGKEEWDGNLTVNGIPAIRVADYMSPEMANKIVEHHNREVAQ